METKNSITKPFLRNCLICCMTKLDSNRSMKRNGEEVVNRGKRVERKVHKEVAVLKRKVRGINCE